MPIRPERRHLYTDPEWEAARQRILKRARNKCQQCKKPGGVDIWTYTWQSWLVDGIERRREHWMVWTRVGGRYWRDQFGKRWKYQWWPTNGLPRRIRVQLSVAHVDPDGPFLEDSNLRAWCQWCHLHFDQQQHKNNRSTRKDAGRPLLQQRGSVDAA